MVVVVEGAVGVVSSGRGVVFERGVFASETGVSGRAKGSFALARSPEEKNAE